MQENGTKKKRPDATSIFYPLLLSNICSYYIIEDLSFLALAANNSASQCLIWESLLECALIFYTVFFQFWNGLVIHAPPVFF